jgi:hypothetical protein
MLAHGYPGLLFGLLAVISCSRTEPAETASSRQALEPPAATAARSTLDDPGESTGGAGAVAADPATPVAATRAAPDGGGRCDPGPLEEAARAVQACAHDRDCELTRFGYCHLGGQTCGALPHQRGASLVEYREALGRYFQQCDERTRCRCAAPTAAICRAGRCAATR